MCCSAAGEGYGWKTDTRCSANDWAFSLGLLDQEPCGVRRGGEVFVACFRYLMVFHAISSVPVEKLFEVPCSSIERSLVFWCSEMLPSLA
jgi:hypothetical protein